MWLDDVKGLVIAKHFIRGKVGSTNDIDKCVHHHKLLH